MQIVVYFSLTQLRKLGGTTGLGLLTLKSEVPARLSCSFAPTNTFICFSWAGSYNPFDSFRGFALQRLYFFLLLQSVFYLSITFRFQCKFVCCCLFGKLPVLAYFILLESCRESDISDELFAVNFLQNTEQTVFSSWSVQVFTKVQADILGRSKMLIKSNFCLENCAT